MCASLNHIFISKLVAQSVFIVLSFSFILFSVVFVLFFCFGCVLDYFFFIQLNCYIKKSWQRQNKRIQRMRNWKIEEHIYSQQELRWDIHTYSVVWMKKRWREKKIVSLAYLVRVLFFAFCCLPQYETDLKSEIHENIVLFFI